ncbi:hypothetical protein GNT69_24980 [Bacillus sp. B15-48]|nr:hypothetical protein [Bacillus sp. B15-48]
MFSSLFGFLGDVFGTLFSVIWDAIVWIGGLLKTLLQSLLDVLIGFFQVIYALIDGILYLIYMIGVLAVKLFLVIFETGKILWAFIVGLGNTLSSLQYTPRSSPGNGYSDILGRLFTNLEVLEINTFAYILLFLVWVITAVAAIKLISSIKGGG